MAGSARRSRRTSRNIARNYRPEDQYRYLDDDDSVGKSKEAKSAVEKAQRNDDDDDDDDDDDEEDTFQPDTADQDDEQEDEELENDVNMFEDEEDDDESDDDSFGRSSLAHSTPKGRRKDQKPISTAAAAALAATGVITGKSPRRKQKNPFQKSGAAERVNATGIAGPTLDKVHKKGVERSVRGFGQETRLKDLFGPDRENLVPVVETRERWKHQEALPSREDGGLRRSYYISEDARLREIEGFRQWYIESGADSFRRGQKRKTMNRQNGSIYLRTAGPDKLNTLMGPMPEPELYTLSKGSFMSTAIPFKEGDEERRGWVFHLGSRIQDTQWAPNEEGNTQYLAVAVEPELTNVHKHAPLENPQAPAFSRTAAFRSAIQIWSLTSTEDGELDKTKEPKLEVVLCTDWGLPKRFRWCPVAPAESAESFKEGMIHLGLLAGIWSDGKVRILDISWPKSHADFHETQYLHYSQAAFEVSPPLTIPTCLHWLSPTSLAVGTAAGTVGIWTLTRDNVFASSGHNLEDEKGYQAPLPWFYKQVADTFILSVVSGWPSRPTFMSITTADGFAKLIDLRSPVADTALSSRGRIFSTSQAWHEHTQSFLMSDEAYNFRNNAIRRYFTNIYNMKAIGQITCCAASPVQPGVLIGCADGAAIAGNPVGRLLNSKETLWQQIWFKHEWRQPVDKLYLKVKKADEENTVNDQQGNDDEDDNQDPAPADPQASEPKHRPRWPQPAIKKVPEAVLQEPMVRITEGYRLQATSLQSSRGNLKGAANREPIKHITIYEEPTAITAVAWNPNLKFGTWAVAGTGSGILRVEDLGV
ncbi:hypothetical protein K491DRAFT_754107 [Lophiostoma macrostomum CBS 122681]|uniref:WD40 repeat-like protein n=1 Tax=Lophiostoma macrostomum CBS 122681 TaxID=1314788 RepID=A0A6A6TPD1_9PLEO|nr:hypothetical protein K491DRAFT_754107 [Lophiostoma macrostomum CBS 122681]